MNRTNVGKQLSGFVGRDVDSQFTQPRRRLYAEGDTVAEELVTKTFENGKTWTWNPAKEGEPDPETGRTPKFDPATGKLIETGLLISDQLGKVGGRNLFGQATQVQPDKEATGQKVPVSVVPEIVNKEDIPDPYPVQGSPDVGTTKGLSSRLGGGALMAGLSSFIPFVGGPLSESIMDERVKEVEGVLGPYDREMDAEDPKGPYAGSPQIFDPTVASTEQARQARDKLGAEKYGELGTKGLPSLSRDRSDPNWAEKLARKIGMPVIDVIDKYSKYSPYVDEGMKISRAAQEGGYGLASAPESKEDKAKRLELTQEHKDAGHANKGQWGRDNKYYQYDAKTGNWLNAKGESNKGLWYGEYIGSGKTGYGQYDLTNPNHPGHQAYMAAKKRREEGEDKDDEEKNPVTYPDVTGRAVSNIVKEGLERDRKLAEALQGKGVKPQDWPMPDGGGDTGGGGGGGAGVDMDSDRFLHEIGLGFTPAYSNTDAQGEWSSDPSIDWNDPVAVTGWEGAEDDGTWNALVASGGAIPFSLGGGLSSIGNQHLEPGSFVLAADVVSGAGDGDTYAGLSRLNKELGIPVAPSGTQGSSTGGPISGSIRGPGSGLDDTHVTSIDGRLPAAVSTGEIVVTKANAAKIAEMLHPDKKMTAEEAVKAGQEGFFHLQRNIRNQKAGTSKGGKQPGPLKTGRGGLLDLMRA